MRKLGWFGKLPRQGDFISHGVSSPLLSMLDRWLCELVQIGLRTHGPMWIQAYFETPMIGAWIPRESLHDLAGTGAALVWMPSVDSAGRAFPFLLVEEAEPGGQACSPPCNLQQWLVQAAGICAAALSEEWTQDRLDQACTDLPRLLSANALAPQHCTGHSHWCRIEPEGGITWLAYLNGLPVGPEFNRLIGLDLSS